MRAKLSGKSVFLLLLFCITSTFALASSSKSTHHYLLKNADIVKIDKVINDTITILTGNVNLIYDDIEFFADNAQIFQNKKRIKLTGNVKAIDDTLEAGAQKATYLHKENELFLERRAYFIEKNSQMQKQKHIRADKINYFRGKKLVEAEGNIFANDLAQDMNLMCGHFKYDIEKGYGVARNNPELTFQRKKTAKIYSKQMEFFYNKHKFTATYNVRIETKDSHTNARFLIYFQDDKKAVLLGNPEFHSDTSDAFAMEFHIFFNEETIDKIFLIKDGEIHFRSKDQTEKLNYLFADKVMLDLENEKLYYINAEEVTKSFLQQSKTKEKEPYINKLKAKGLDVFFDDNENLEKVIASENIKGIYKFLPKE
ncbi:MAG: hypothetical protein J7J77_00765 [Candidatus Cloacimonetes bacterium]|nr:hypothetical protein [Candidatus Cloacimonadota bacterium]